MTNFKRFSAAIAATLMAATLSVPMAMNASAATITIEGMDPGYTQDTATHTYQAYQIFSGTLSGGTLSDIEWGNGVDTTTILGVVQAIELDDGSKPFENCENASKVAEALAGKDYDSEIAKKFAAAVATSLTTTEANIYEATGNVNTTITVGGDGYYLVQEKVDSLDGANGAMTRYILEVAGTGTINLKSSFPTSMKKVYEETLDDTTDESVTFAGDAYNPGSGYNDVADYDIGDDVPFRLYGTMPSEIGDYSTYYYKFTDTLGSQFTLDTSSIEVSAQNGNDVVAIDAACYTATPTINGLTVTFTNVKAITSDGNPVTVDADTIIIVDYNAELNTSANVGYTGQVNAVYLEYSNNPNAAGSGDLGKTTEDGVIVFTYGIDVNKVIAGTEDKLADAVFAVYYETTEEVDGETVTTKHYIKTDDANCYAGDLAAKPTGTIVDGKTTYTASNAAGIWKSNTTGNITILGLDKDKTYYLEELAPPAGYNSLSEPVEVTIASTLSDGTIYQQAWTYNTAANANKDALDEITVNGAEVADDTDDLGTIKVENSAGAQLPGTGGIGTTLFYLGGGAMVAVAGIYLISKKRMKNNEE